MKRVKSVLAVKFNSTHNPKELIKVCNEDLETFRNVPGLIEKYYVGEKETGAISGIYLFESNEARATFWNSELASQIPVRYGVIPETLRVEKYDMMIVLNEKAIA